MNITKDPMIMNELEVAEMQRKIDEGILLAQERLIKRAKHDNLTLVVARNGQVVELSAEVSGSRTGSRSSANMPGQA